MGVIHDYEEMIEYKIRYTGDWRSTALEALEEYEICRPA